MTNRPLAFVFVAAAFSLATTSVVAQDVKARVARVLKVTPLIDGHNDWPDVLREREGDGRWTLDLRSGLGQRTPEPYNTDIDRLRLGMVGDAHGGRVAINVDPFVLFGKIAGH